MTQEEKQLLLTDLCARLPYGVKVRIEYIENDEFGVDEGEFNGFAYEEVNKNVDIITSIKPYLRSMSSMTEEEKNFIYNGHIEFWVIEDYCNKYHLDYRGLIEKGLALEAPEGMYKNAK